MNRNTYSAECLDGGFCSACTYEDCACRCHMGGEFAATEEFDDDAF